MKIEQDTAVTVTTEFRGVFFGYVLDANELPDSITLRDARMCVYWDATVKGVLGLAKTGPNSFCRIGPKVPEFKAWKVTSITKCTPEAIASWEAEPWN